MRRSRRIAIASLLLLAVALAALLAFQAQTAVTYHRATAERVLRDYSALAALRLAGTAAQQLLYYGLPPLFRALAAADAGLPGAPLPTLARLARTARPEERLDPGCCRGLFRLDLRRGTLAIVGASDLGPEQQRRMRDTLRDHSTQVFRAPWPFALLFAEVEGQRRALAYTVVRDPRGAVLTAYGVELAPVALDSFFRQLVAGTPLLPRALTGGVTLDSLGSVTVTSPGDHPLFRTEPQYEPRFAGRDTLGAMLGGLEVRVALRPEMAERLVIGGLPRSRLPYLLGLLALTAGLVATAWLQLRREYELARLRADFVAGVSHELRTPLAQIRLFSETLLLGRLRSDEEWRRSLEIVDQEARRLTHLVENLLHFARSERQATRIDLEPTDLGGLLRGVLDGFAPLAAARQVQMRAELPNGVVVPADPEAVRRIVLNLLDNAIKYGPPGQTITVAVERADGGARIRIDDRGPGIPAADRERVWERFSRLRRDRNSAGAGTGIGLAVVRELATLHRGRAWVEDAPGGGARFVVDLPAGPARAAPDHAEIIT
jgi:signal transduction histidine kinase